MLPRLRDNLQNRLVSPCCQAPLAGLRCEQCGREFPTVRDVPVLVDFERSVLVRESVLGSAGASLIARRGRGRFSRIWELDNAVGREHARRMAELLDSDAEILVIGGAVVGKGMEPLYERFDMTGFDIYASDLTQLVADAHQIPFATGTFDAVIVQAVLEHVLDPALVVGEIWRVLKPEGLVYAETPFLQQVHEGAYDFTRFTDSGHRWLFRRFEAIDSGLLAGPGYQALWTLDYVVRALLRSRKAGLRARKIGLPLRFLDRFMDRRYALDAASAVYFFGRRSDSEINPRDVVAYYQGAQ
jgi:SAM-dependent methyltransferase